MNQSVAESVACQGQYLQGVTVPLGAAFIDAAQGEVSPVNPSDTSTENATVERVTTLTGIIDELAGLCSVLSEQARDFVRDGGGIDTALAEINELRAGPKPVTEIEQQLTAARSNYAAVLTERRRVLKPGRKASLEAAGDTYKTALAAKIEAATDLQEGASDTPTEMSVESLVERGLSVLTSTLLSEEKSLRERVAEAKVSSFMERAMSSPKLYKSLLVGLVASSIAIRSGLMPEEGEMGTITHATGFGVDGLAAFGFAGIAEDRLFELANTRWASKQLIRGEAAIKHDEAVADDLIDRTVSRVDEELDGARLLAGRLFRHHLEEIKGVASRSPESVEISYAQLVQEIVAEEVRRSTNALVSNGKRIVLFRGLSLVGAFIAGPIIANVGNSFTITRDLEESLRKEV